jgi:hypothetical protein
MILSTLKPSPLCHLTGLLEGYVARGQQTRGRLESVGLFRPTPTQHELAPPLANLVIESVPSYGTVVFRNRADTLLIAPMHVGFFQEGAQNHATSQVLLLGPGETLSVDDCFCIQESQGGYLAAAHQRFLMLPHALRHEALRLRGTPGYDRLWSAIDAFTRRFGVTRGGHLERFLRPFFRRLVPYRHGFEAEPGQVGAAWFVADELVGVEVCADPAQFAELLPILAIYAYAPAAILSDLEHPEEARPMRRLDLLGIGDLSDLRERLAESRCVDERSRVEPLADLCEETWTTTFETERQGLRLLTVEQGPWLGQVVRAGEETVYLSLVRC